MMYNVGAIGAGMISDIYFENIQKYFQNVKLAAVCDLIPERAEKAQKKYGIPKIYSSMEEMFADPQIDIILNLTWPTEHYKVTRAALLAGKHVYTEKPLVSDYAQAKELVALARERHLYLAGAPDTFMGAAIQTCRYLIDKGVIGKVTGGHFSEIFQGPEVCHSTPEIFYEPDANPIFDLAPYYITELINLLGGIHEIQGMCGKAFPERRYLTESGEEKTFAVNIPTHYENIFLMNSGAIVSFTLSYDACVDKQEIEIYGEEGKMYLPYPLKYNNRIFVFRKKTNKTEEYPLLFDHAIKNAHGIGLEDMARAMALGEECRCGDSQLLYVSEVLDGILKSAESGQMVTIKTPYERPAPMPPLSPDIEVVPIQPSLYERVWQKVRLVLKKTIAFFRSKK